MGSDFIFENAELFAKLFKEKKASNELFHLLRSRSDNFGIFCKNLEDDAATRARSSVQINGGEIWEYRIVQIHRFSRMDEMEKTKVLTRFKDCLREVKQSNGDRSNFTKAINTLGRFHNILGFQQLSNSNSKALLLIMESTILDEILSNKL